MLNTNSHATNILTCDLASCISMDMPEIPCSGDSRSSITYTTG